METNEACEKREDLNVYLIVHLIDWMTDWTNNWVSEWVSDWMSDRLDWMNVCPSDWVRRLVPSDVGFQLEKEKSYFLYDDDI